MHSRAAVEAWAAENVGELHIGDPRPDGTVDVQHADPIISLRVEGMAQVGVAHLVQADGTIRINDQLSYRHLRDLPDGTAAYEQI